MTIKEFFDNQNWIFARTYADKAPHEYCLKEQVIGKEEDFVNAVKYIWKNGFEAKFWGYPNTYLYLDGHLYWVMHPVAEEVILINRSNIDDYDLIIYSKKERQKKNVDHLQGD